MLPHQSCNLFLAVSPQGNKSKTKQTGLHQTEKLHTVKGSSEMKRQLRNGEGALRRHLWQGANINIYKELVLLHIPKHQLS